MLGTILPSKIFIAFFNFSGCEIDKQEYLLRGKPKMLNSKKKIIVRSQLARTLCTSDDCIS